MPFYSELLDTHWSSAEDRAVAKTVLMLRSMSPLPCELTTSHAFSCHVIFEDCATDDTFLWLVKNRQIRFRLRPDGLGPRGALVAALENENYRLDSWPEIWPNKQTGSWSEARELRADSLRVLRDPRNPQEIKDWTANDDVNKRLKSLLELFSAQEKSQYVVKEHPRAQVFHDRLATAFTRVPIDYPEVKELVRKVGRLGIRDRSAAYIELEKEDGKLADHVDAAKGVVDTVLNEALAASLDQKLLSIDREIPLALGIRKKSQPQRTGVSVRYVAGTTPEEEHDLSHLAITWTDVMDTAIFYKTSNDPGQLEARMRFEKLAKILSERNVAAPAAAGTFAGNVAKAAVKHLPSAVGATPPVVAMWLTLHFDGGLALLMFDIASTIMAPTFQSTAERYASEYAKRQATKVQTDRYARRLSGWLDRCVDG
jgi:hypothetical protein